MTKKVVTVYGMLFLFAFSFALSFTLASSAQAEQTCCVVSWCPGDPSPGPSIQGHWWRPNPWSNWECIYTGEHPCDMYFIC